MYRLVLILLTCLTLSSTHAFANVDAGSIGEIKGSGVLERGRDVITGDTGTTVQTMDTAVTARGKMRIDFIDDTRVDITEHSRLLIDEFVYDPANDIGSLSIKATLGGVRYASGQIAKKYRQNVKIKTPSATIGVRGTDFVMVVDEMGGSMITLLPSCSTNGMCYVGEIEVETDAGMVIMNQAFQSTMTSHRMQPPSPPIIIDEAEQALTQLIILRKKNPYEEEEDIIRKKARAMYDFLGLDFLDFDALDSDMLNVDDIWVTALDESDYLLGDLLYDLLDQLNAALMAIFRDELLKQNETMLKQDTTKYGFDSKTGIRLDKIGDSWLWQREDNAGNNMIRLDLNRNYGYTLDVKQGDFELYDYTLGNSRNNTIAIIQIN